MSVTLAAGVTLIDFLNKSLETLKIIQKDELNLNEVKIHLATLTQQLSLTMVEAAQLQGQLAQKNEEIRQLTQKLNIRQNLSFNSENQMYWMEGDPTPFCTKCYENDGKNLHLTYFPATPTTHHAYGVTFPGEDEHYNCFVCNKTYFLK